MKRIGVWAGAAILLIASARAAEPVHVAVTDDQVQRVHREAIVVDGHADTLWRVLDDGDDISVKTGKGHIDIPRLKEGGVDAQFFSVWVSPAYCPDHAARRAMRLIDALYRVVAKSPDRIVLAKSPGDIRSAASAGKVAALIGIEGGQAIENDLALLRMFHEMGARYMTLTWSFTLDWADSSGGSSQWHGLNDFGVKVVQEMNRLGMLVDVSHVSDETFQDVMKVTKAPVIASHSACRALCDAKRNMTDDMLRAMRDNGGVVMVNFFPAFLDQQYRNRSDEREAAARPKLSAIGERFLLDPLGREKAMWALYRQIDSAITPPPLSRLIDHIEHVIKVAGIDHVGLGSDFDGVTSLPAGMEDVTKLPSITRALLERGYSESDVSKVLGGNFMRVFDEVVRRSEAGSGSGSRKSSPSR